MCAGQPGTEQGSHLQVPRPRVNRGQDETWVGLNGQPGQHGALGGHQTRLIPRPPAGRARGPGCPRLAGRRASPSRWRRRPGLAAGAASACRDVAEGAAEPTSPGGSAGGKGRSARVHNPGAPPHPRPSSRRSGATVKPRSWEGPGPRRAHARGRARTWRSGRQWRRITASVRRATVQAALSRAPRGSPATAPRRARPRAAMDTRILCS